MQNSMQSQFIISTKRSSRGKTVLDNSFATPPFKFLTLPQLPHSWQGGLNVMQMSSSPGILAGDELTLRFNVTENTALTVSTQAFTRVQSMNPRQSAKQYTEICLQPNSRFCYLPHPVVLHSQSAFTQVTEIKLQDHCELLFSDTVAIGRVLNGERYAFEQYSARLTLSYHDQLLLLDNIQWFPQQHDLTVIGQMEGFSHQGTLIYANFAFSPSDMKACLENVYQDLEQQGLTQNKDYLLGISLADSHVFIVRILAYRADKIEQIFHHIAQRLISQNKSAV